MVDGAGPDAAAVTQARRDPEQLAAGLRRWLATQVGGDAAPEVAGLDRSSANGLSSETLLFEATWAGPDGPEEARLVARLEPDGDDAPVFPAYALGHQVEVLRAVAEHTSVPVPDVRWWEPDRSWLGAPFFVMGRVDGEVPPDVLPYNFGGNWLFDAPPERQRALQDATVDVLVRIHAIPDAAGTFAFLDRRVPGDTPVAKDVAWTRAWYDYAVADVGPSPLVERALAWLEGNLPAGSGDTVLCWGDARIGNVLYRDFAPVGVLDWEMATTGPRELDVSWMVFAHQVFETITGAYDLPGMPAFLSEADVVETYERRSGVRLRPLQWFHIRNATQWAVVFMRTGARQIHFGEIERPDDIEALFHHKPLLERLLTEVGA